MYKINKPKLNEATQPSDREAGKFGNQQFLDRSINPSIGVKNNMISQGHRADNEYISELDVIPITIINHIIHM
jgi:hypothetical protein